MPHGWLVRWSGEGDEGYFGDCHAITHYASRVVALSSASFGDDGVCLERGQKGVSVLEILLHEFVHVRCPDIEHGGEFNRLVRLACAEIGLESVYHLLPPPRQRPKGRVIRGRSLKERLDGCE